MAKCPGESSSLPENPSSSSIPVGVRVAGRLAIGDGRGSLTAPGRGPVPVLSSPEAGGQGLSGGSYGEGWEGRGDEVGFGEGVVQGVGDEWQRIVIGSFAS